VIAIDRSAGAGRIVAMKKQWFEMEGNGCQVIFFESYS
jgi:hypothetical protein